MWGSKVQRSYESAISLANERMAQRISQPHGKKGLSDFELPFQIRWLASSAPGLPSNWDPFTKIRSDPIILALNSDNFEFDRSLIEDIAKVKSGMLPDHALPEFRTNYNHYEEKRR